MPSRFDPATLRTRVRQRADMVNSTFVSDSEIDTFNERAFQELYGMAVGEWEDIYVRKFETTIAPSAGLTGNVAASEFNLPSDVKKLRSVRIKNDRFLSPISIREIEGLDAAGGSQRTSKPRYYWLYGNAYANPVPSSPTVASLGMSIALMPPPDTTYTITVYYVPAVSLEEVSRDDGFGNPNTLAMLADWDEYVVLTACIKCKDKEESDVSVLLQERAMLLENIKKSWQPVDTSEAARVVQLNDRRTTFNPYDYDPEDYFG